MKHKQYSAVAPQHDLGSVPVWEFPGTVDFDHFVVDIEKQQMRVLKLHSAVTPRYDLESVPAWEFPDFDHFVADRKEKQQPGVLKLHSPCTF